MRLFARYTDTRLYVRIFLRILIPFPIHLRVLLLSMSRLFNFYRENCVRGVSQLLCLHNESPFPFVMANVQGSERSLSMDLTISDDRVQQLAEVCKKRLNTMSAADHIKDRGEKLVTHCCLVRELVQTGISRPDRPGSIVLLATCINTCQSYH